MQPLKTFRLSYFPEMMTLSFRTLGHKVSNYGLSPQNARGLTVLQLLSKYDIYCS